MECKFVNATRSYTKGKFELIDTLWNVNNAKASNPAAANKN